MEYDEGPATRTRPWDVYLQVEYAAADAPPFEHNDLWDLGATSAQDTTQYHGSDVSTRGSGSRRTYTVRASMRSSVLERCVQLARSPRCLSSILPALEPSGALCKGASGKEHMRRPPLPGVPAEEDINHQHSPLPVHRVRAQSLGVDMRAIVPAKLTRR